MADSNVQVTAGAGTGIDTRTTTNGEHRQVVVIGNDGDLVGGLTAYGAFRVTLEPTSLFSDTFDTAAGFETVNKWTTGGTVVPTVTTGGANIQPGAATSATTSLVSKPLFTPQGLTFTALGHLGKFENIGPGLGTVGFLNSHRFMGFGTIPTTWAAAYTGSSTTGPLLYGYGFEIDVDGHMYCVVYDNGVRTRMAVVGGGGSLRVNDVRTVFDGNNHQFLTVQRQDVLFWYVDSTNAPIASYAFNVAGHSTPDVASLPIRFHTINGTSAPSGTMVHRQTAVGVGDTGRNAAAISDGTHPWRKAKVSNAGELKVGSGRNVTFEGWAASWRVQGTAATPINLFSMENTTGSAIQVALRRLAVDITSNASAYVISSYIRMWRSTTVPTGGTALSKLGTDTSQSSAANVVLRGPASADGTASAITYATPSGTPMRSQAIPTAMTAVGQWLTDDLDMWKFDFPPLILRPGESILVAHHGGNSGTGLAYTVKCAWEEFTL